MMAQERVTYHVAEAYAVQEAPVSNGISETIRDRYLWPRLQGPSTRRRNGTHRVV